MRITMTVPIAAAITALGCSSSDGTSAAGDSRQQARALARDDLPCQTDADCCVVFDGCLASGYVVSAKDQAAAAALLAQAPNDACLACIPPAIQVSCGANGFCTGAKIECNASLFDQGMKNHCGALTLPTGCAVKPASLPGGTLPAPQTKLILGCG